LDDADLDLLLETGRLDKFHDESGNKGGNFISIEHPESPSFVQIKVHQSICVAVETASPLTGTEMRFEGGWHLLLGLDIICTTCVVQGTRGGNSVVYGEEGKASTESRYEFL
jgi:hypothetical protein